MKIQLPIKLVEELLEERVIMPEKRKLKDRPNKYEKLAEIVNNSHRETEEETRIAVQLMHDKIDAACAKISKENQNFSMEQNEIEEKIYKPTMRKLIDKKKHNYDTLDNDPLPKKTDAEIQKETEETEKAIKLMNDIFDNNCVGDLEKNDNQIKDLFLDIQSMLFDINLKFADLTLLVKKNLQDHKGKKEYDRFEQAENLPDSYSMSKIEKKVQ